MSKIYSSKKVSFNLGISWLITSSLAILLLIPAIFLRYSTKHSLGVAIPISFIILLLFMAGGFLAWKMPNSKFNPVRGLLDHLSTTGKIGFDSILLTEISLYFGIIGFWILFSSIKVSKFTYLGIFPGIIIVFLTSFLTLCWLIKYSQPWKDFFSKIIRSTFHDYFVFFISILCFLLIGLYLANQFLTLIQPILGHITEIELINSIILLTIVILFIDIVYFVLFQIQKINERHQSKRIRQLLPERQKSSQITLSPVLLSFIATFLLFTVILLFFKIGYDVNDDIYTVQILSGYYSGSPVQFPIYSNVLVGLLYQLLFQINSRINWVTFFYLAVNFLSVWNLFYNVFLLKQKYYFTIFFIGLIVVFESYFLLAITFTTIAAVACVSGLVSLVSIIYSKRPIWNWQLFSSIGLLLLGSLIRFSTLILVFIPFVPFFLFSLPKIFSKRNLAPILLTGLILGCAFLFNSIYLHLNPDWESFQRYTSIRSLVQDTPRMFMIDDAPRLSDLVGWSSNDYYLFNNWFSLDKSVYSEANLQILISNFPNWFQDIPTAYYFFITQILVHPVIDLIFILISSWFVLILFTPKRRAILLSSFAYILLISVGFLMVWGYKLPQRIIIPTLFTQLLINFYLPKWISDDNESNEIYPPLKMDSLSISILLLALFSLFMGWRIFVRPFQQKSVISERQTEYSYYLNGMNQLVDNGLINEDSVIISSGSGIPFEYMSPLAPLEFPKVKVVVSGWNTFSPVYESALQKAGISDDPLIVSDHKNLYLLSPEKLIPMEIRFYKEHYNLDLKPRIIYILNIDNGYRLMIYQLIK